MSGERCVSVVLARLSRADRGRCIWMRPTWGRLWWRTTRSFVSHRSLEVFRAIYRLYSISLESKQFRLKRSKMMISLGNWTFFIQTMIQWMGKVQILGSNDSWKQLIVSFETRIFSWFLQISKSLDFQIHNLESMFLISSYLLAISV